MGEHERLLSYWRAKGYQPPPGAPVEAVERFEAEHGLALPEGLRSFLLLADGGGLGDDNFYELDYFTFWPLGRLEVADDLAAGRHVLFCDFLLNSHAYALSPASGSDGKGLFLVPFAPYQPWRIGATFADFIDMYIANDDRLHSRPSGCDL